MTYCPIQSAALDTMRLAETRYPSVLLIPAVSTAVIGFRFSKLVRGGLEIVGRVIFVFYLYQPRVREAFEAK